VRAVLVPVERHPSLEQLVEDATHGLRADP
jgi:hypothetical protein